MPDPNVTAAIEEMKELLTKRDLAGTLLKSAFAASVRTSRMRKAGRRA